MEESHCCEERRTTLSITKPLLWTVLEGLSMSRLSSVMYHPRSKQQFARADSLAASIIALRAAGIAEWGSTCLALLGGNVVAQPQPRRKQQRLVNICLCPQPHTHDQAPSRKTHSTAQVQVQRHSLAYIQHEPLWMQRMRPSASTSFNNLLVGRYC